MYHSKSPIDKLGLDVKLAPISPINSRLLCVDKKKETVNTGVTLPNNTLVPYENIHFKGMFLPKTKRLNIGLEVAKLSRQIEGILEEQTNDSIFASAFEVLSKGISNIAEKKQRLEKILNASEIFSSRPATSYLEYDLVRGMDKEKNTLVKQIEIIYPKISELYDLMNSFETIEVEGGYSVQCDENSKSKLEKLTENVAKLLGLKMRKKVPEEDKEDLLLINKFKNAIKLDDFDFEKIYKKHYSGLLTINTLEELKEQYPYIKLPKSPVEVVVPKILATFPRKIYEKMYQFKENNDKEGVDALWKLYSSSAIEKMATAYNLDFDSAYEALQPLLSNAFVNKIFHMKKIGTFAAIPEKPKNEIPKLTPLDIDLLSIDYDQLVLSTIKKMYLEKMPLNEIVYKEKVFDESGEEYVENNVTINLKNTKSTDYKFPIPSRKIENLMSIAKKIKEAKRDYDNFSVMELRERLDFYMNNDTITDEFLVEKIVEFDYSKFLAGDIEQLRKLLRTFDKVKDEVITQKEAIEIIKLENIHPADTHKFNEKEKLELMMRIKEERRKNYQIEQNCREFNDAVNLLYQNNLGVLAEVVDKYCPNSLDKDVVDNSKEIIQYINQYLNHINVNQSEREILKHKLTCFEKYCSSKQILENTDLINLAERYAKDKNGIVDKIKAGSYIKNYELLEAKIASNVNLHFQPKVLEIVDSTTLSKSVKAEALSKYDEYFYSPDVVKTSLTKVLNLFNSDSIIEKNLLKYIVENDYVNFDTRVIVRHDMNYPDAVSLIKSVAKIAILNKYPFPLCNDVFRKFEHAASKYSREKDSEGIKIYNRKHGNTVEKFMELKVKGVGMTDRIFSTNCDYVFDLYAPDGVFPLDNNHKKKK